MATTKPLRPLARAVLSTQSDERLVLLTREGNEEAFAEIVRRHRPGLLRLARSLGSGERSEDVVQDGFVRAWRALLGSDAAIDLRPWLTTIVRNRALSAHAASRNHEQLDETIDGVRQPGDIALMHEELRSAVSAVNSLPEAQRQALVRSALEGESHEQIAAELQTTPGAVRQLIHRARTGLRNGVGALVPLPAVRALAEISGQQVATGGAGSGTIAAVAAGGGGSLAVKAVTVVAVGAAVAGSGIAIERHRNAADDSSSQGKPATSAASVAGVGQDFAEPTAAGSKANASAAKLNRSATIAGTRQGAASITDSSTSPSAGDGGGGSGSQTSATGQAPPPGPAPAGADGGQQGSGVGGGSQASGPAPAPPPDPHPPAGDDHTQQGQQQQGQQQQQPSPPPAHPPGAGEQQTIQGSGQTGTHHEGSGGSLAPPP